MWTEVTECAPLSDLITPADQRGASFLGASPSERRAAGLPLLLQKLRAIGSLMDCLRALGFNLLLIIIKETAPKV